MQEVFSDVKCEVDVMSHKGIIKSIENHVYFVSIISQSACSSCHSQGLCSISEMQEKIIEVPRRPGENYSPGDSVEVLISKSMGTKAILIGYFIPFSLLMVTLIFSLRFFQNEGLAGIISIGSLIVYYFALYLLKNRFKKTFSFSIRSLNGQV